MIPQPAKFRRIPLPGQTAVVPPAAPSERAVKRFVRVAPVEIAKNPAEIRAKQVLLRTESELAPPPSMVSGPRRMPGHIGMTARAGTGKTFTLVEGIKRQFGNPTPGITGNAQQEAIWKEMCRGPRPGRVVMLAFNRTVKSEIKRKITAANLPGTIDVYTSHAFGLVSCKKAGMAPGRDGVQKFKMQMMVEILMGIDARTIFKEYPGLLQSIDKITTLLKVNLMGVGYGEYPECSSEIVDWIVGHYGINLPEEYVETIYQLVPEALQMSIERTDIIDYADMIALPCIHKVDIRPYDECLVDEAQDLTVAARVLAGKAGGRMIIVGDPAQAIYGFAGADCESMPNFLKMLKSHPLGLCEFPLTQTRRCGRVIVDLAREIVPDIEPLDNAHEGEVVYIDEKEYLGLIEDSDMVVCRTNAPLVSGVMRLLRQHKKAYIEGRETGNDLIDLIQRLKAMDVVDLVGKLDDWYTSEVAKMQRRRYVSEEVHIALADKRDCVLAFCEGMTSVKEVTDIIKNIFASTMEEGDKPKEGVRFSSIHKAKGLEAGRVFFLREDNCPHPMAATEWQKMQEWNLRYVAMTRAMRTLFMVKSNKER